MPFSPNQGVTHYYGVGAYMRPLDDSRRADVRFAAESLGFAHYNRPGAVVAVPPVQSPLWKERVPRDRGASWDFEDVRDHYFASSMVSSRIGCAGRILISILLCRRRSSAKSRKSVMPRGGGRVRAATALWSGRCRIYCLARLGRIDSTGEPKPTWYALRRPFRPVQVLFTDEGTNGLDVHVVNESNVTLDLDLEVRCLRDGRQKVVSGKLGLSIEARAKCKIACTDFFGAFFNTTYAFRFGPPSHDVTVARLIAPDTEALIAEAFYFPLGRMKAFHEAEITASVAHQDDHWFHDLRSDRLHNRYRSILRPIGRRMIGSTYRRVRCGG